MKMSKLVCVDPGHGGRDSGAVGPGGTRESDVNLRVGWFLRGELSMRGILNVMTRHMDKRVSLAVRPLVADTAPANLFISLHCNAFSDPQAHGFEVFHYPNSSRGIDLSIAIRDAVVKAGILGVERCLEDAKPMDVPLAMRGSRNGIKADGRLSVLRRTKMPAVLVEMAFLSNPDEEWLLASDTGQLAFARAIADGIEAYLGDD